MDKSAKNRYFEGCGKEGPILAIFVCEFHSTYGPKISCQVPNDFISKETFESVNVYLIPKPQLIRSLITVTLDDIKIVGYPVRIESEVYPRNAFYYNLCFVCNSWARTNQYDLVVKHLSAYLRQLEEDENFLSKMENSGDTSKVTTLLNQVLNQLNSSRISLLQEGKRSVRLQVGRQRDIDVPVHCVPILTVPDTQDLTTHQHWDQQTLHITTKILQHVDGFNNVEKICTAAGVDLTQVKSCLQSLINDGIVKLISEYSDTNCYIVTSCVRRLLVDKQFQSQCISHVSLQPGGGCLANIRDVFRVYCSLNHGATVRDLSLRYDMSQLRIDEKRLVQFGLVHNLIRKLNKHVSYIRDYSPEELIKAGDVTLSPVNTGLSSECKDMEDILENLDGKKCLEEICLMTGLPQQQLESIATTHLDVICIYK